MIIPVNFNKEGRKQNCPFKQRIGTHWGDDWCILTGEEFFGGNGCPINPCILNKENIIVKIEGGE